MKSCWIREIVNGWILTFTTEGGESEERGYSPSGLGRCLADAGRYLGSTVPDEGFGGEEVSPEVMQRKLRGRPPGRPPKKHEEAEPQTEGRFATLNEVPFDAEELG